MIVVWAAVVIGVLSFAKNASIWLFALGYHITMDGGVGDGVNIGGGDSLGG